MKNVSLRQKIGLSHTNRYFPTVISENSPKEVNIREYN